jgi:hypothetical protein
MLLEEARQAPDQARRTEEHREALLVRVLDHRRRLREAAMIVVEQVSTDPSALTTKFYMG